MLTSLTSPRLSGLIALALLVATNARADFSFEYGRGREEGSLVMLNVFTSLPAPVEWLALQLHYGQITRNANDREPNFKERAAGIDFENDVERFPFYGADIVFGHKSVNPYIVLVGGRSKFRRASHRLGTSLNYHWAVEIGALGEHIGWFGRLHHWSNGKEISEANANLGEDFATLGIEVLLD